MKIKEKRRVGRPSIKGRPLTAAEATKRTRARRAAEGYEEFSIMLDPRQASAVAKLSAAAGVSRNTALRALINKGMEHYFLNATNPQVDDSLDDGFNDLISDAEFGAAMKALTDDLARTPIDLDIFKDEPIDLNIFNDDQTSKIK